MKLVVIRALVTAVLASASLATVMADDSKAEAMRDLQMGMEGLQAATKDPALLAQLMQDLQNPEMMAEAKKMMDNPEFKKQMKAMSKSKEFKDGVKKSVDMMKDPNTQAQMEAKLEHMVNVGNNELKKNAQSAMADAMNSMNDPEVMAEMTRMMKDPSFQGQLAAMAKDPNFQNYMKAMEDMMKDPAAKRQMENVKESIRASL